MNPEAKAAFANLLIQAANTLDAYALRTDLHLPYDATSGLVGVAYDIRQGAVALTGAPGAAGVYLDGAERGLTGLIADHSSIGDAPESARAMNAVLRTLAALKEATGRAPESPEVP